MSPVLLYRMCYFWLYDITGRGLTHDLYVCVGYLTSTNRISVEPQNFILE